MLGGLVDAPRSRLFSSTAMKRVLVFLIAIASVIFVYFSVYDASDSLNADTLYPLSLALEISEGLENWQFWTYAGYTAWFPDITAIVLISHLFPRQHYIWVNVVWGLLQTGLFLWFNAVILGHIIQGQSKIRAWAIASLSLLLFFILSDRRLLDTIIYPVHHFAAFLISLAAIATYLELMDAGKQPLSVLQKIGLSLLLIATIPATLSDPFILLFGTVPLLLVQGIVRWGRSRSAFAHIQIDQDALRGLDRFCLSFAIATFLGCVLYKMTPVSNKNYFQLSVANSLDSIRSFTNNVLWSPSTLLALLLVTGLSILLVWPYPADHAISHLRKRVFAPAIHISRFNIYLLFTLIAIAISVVVFIGFYGLFGDYYHFRYVQPLTFCAPVLIGVGLAIARHHPFMSSLAQGGKYKLIGCALLVILTAADAVLITQARRQYAPENNLHGQNLVCINQLGIDHYASDYWWAKPVHVLSGGAVKPIQLTPAADYYPWVTSTRWYRDLTQVEGKLGVLIQVGDKVLIDPAQVVQKTSASVVQQCGDLTYLVSP